MIIFHGQQVIISPCDNQRDEEHIFGSYSENCKGEHCYKLQGSHPKEKMLASSEDRLDKEVVVSKSISLLKKELFSII